MESQLHLVHFARPHQLAVLPIHMYLDAIMQKSTPPLPCPGEYAIWRIGSDLCIYCRRHRKVMTTSIILYCNVIYTLSHSSLVDGYI